MIEMKLGFISCVSGNIMKKHCVFTIRPLKNLTNQIIYYGKAEVIHYKGIVYKKIKDYQSALNQIDNCLELAKKYDLIYLVSHWIFK